MLSEYLLIVLALMNFLIEFTRGSIFPPKRAESRGHKFYDISSKKILNLVNERINLTGDSLGDFVCKNVNALKTLTLEMTSDSFSEWFDFLKFAKYSNEESPVKRGPKIWIRNDELY